MFYIPLLKVLCIASHVLFFSLSFGLFFILLLGLLLFLFLIKFLFLLGYNKFIRFFLYIINIDKWLYMELATNQYKYFIWYYSLSDILWLLFYFLTHLFFYFLLNFCSSLNIIDIFVFLSILLVLMNNLTLS